MGEIKIGDYVRTRGIIGKLIRIEFDKIDVSLKWYVLDINESQEVFVNKPYIEKYSKNIIDLIEVGDYVNGILITGKEGTLLYTDIKGIDNSGYHIPISQYGENIKNIVTKEQFKQVEYRIEEEQNG